MKRTMGFLRRMSHRDKSMSLRDEPKSSDRIRMNVCKPTSEEVMKAMRCRCGAVTAVALLLLTGGVPAAAETRWNNLLAEVRQHFRGTVLFALPYNNVTIAPPVGILQNTDGVYLLWFAKLSDSPTPNKTGLIAEIGRLLDENVAPIQMQVNKPFIIALSYPSSTYSATGCIPNGSGGCYDWTALNRPKDDLTTVDLDIQQQVDLYEAMFNAISPRPWVNGLVSRGYFAPVMLQDKSASIHGKPAADLLWYWFPRLLGNIK